MKLNGSIIVYLIYFIIVADVATVCSLIGDNSKETIDKIATIVGKID